MKFRKESAIFDAIKFEYTKGGVTRLRNFAGKNVGRISKERRIGAIAEVYFVDIGINRTASFIAYEGLLDTER